MSVCQWYELGSHKYWTIRSFSIWPEPVSTFNIQLNNWQIDLRVQLITRGVRKIGDKTDGRRRKEKFDFKTSQFLSASAVISPLMSTIRSCIKYSGRRGCKWCVRLSLHFCCLSVCVISAVLWNNSERRGGWRMWNQLKKQKITDCFSWSGRNSYTQVSWENHWPLIIISYKVLTSHLTEPFTVCLWDEEAVVQG